jgi:IS30 family transposase
MLIKFANKDTESVVSALIKQSQRLPSELYRSLTWDRGKELADHQRLTLATEVDVYFCDPRSPWQRGSNENTNRLLRQYLPRGTNLSLHSDVPDPYGRTVEDLDYPYDGMEPPDDDEPPADDKDLPF